MGIDDFVRIAIGASVPVLVFAMGLNATFADASSIVRATMRPPHRWLRAILAMHVAVPAAAVAIAHVGALHPAVRVALLAIAVAPIPPVLPGKQMRFGADARYVFGLLVAVSLSSIVLVPLAVAAEGAALGRTASADPATVARIVALTVLLPLGAGMVVHHVLPAIAARLAPWASRAGGVLLVAGLLPLLAGTLPAIRGLLGDGTVIAIVALAVTALAAGHALGGPSPGERTALAMASTMRHPGVALALAGSNAPGEPRVAAAVLLYIGVAVVVTTAYGRFRDRGGSRP